MGVDGREDVDLAQRRGRLLSRFCLERPGEEAAARRVRDQRVHRRARVRRFFEWPPQVEKWGILAGNTGYFKMDQVEVPAQNLVGREGEGFKIAMFALDQGRYTVAAGATGLIRACRDASVKYAGERKTWGVAIGQHQLVKETPRDDRPDGVRLSGVALAVDTLGMAKEQRAPEHVRDRSRQMVFHRCLGASGG